jgi:methylated-DNA-[protein]-cysteine S-methyltransferase
VRGDVLVGVAFDGDSGGTLRKVGRRFAGEEVRDAREAGGVRAAFDCYFAGDTAALDALRVDPGGTPFQSAVWMALREIAAGKTWSYQAVRAVGAANGMNPVPLVLPCHRVIGKNGKLVGYGGGMGRKSWLLRHERVLQGIEGW